MLKFIKDLFKDLVKTGIAILVTIIIAVIIANACKPENRKETIQFLNKYGVLDVAQAFAPESEEIQKAKVEAGIYDAMDAIDEYYEEEATMEEKIVYEITKDAAEEYVDDFVQNYYAEDSYEEENYYNDNLESQTACWSVDSVNDEYFIGEVNQMVLAGVIRESVVTDWQDGLMSDQEFVNYVNEYYPCYIEMINVQ
jgi:hypothetical protein